jgi:hypothetical protein
MAKRKKMPKTLLAFRLDDDTIVCGEHVDEVSEDFAGEMVGVYELRAVGKLNVEKSIDGKAVKKMKVGR